MTSTAVAAIPGSKRPEAVKRINWEPAAAPTPTPTLMAMLASPNHRADLSPASCPSSPAPPAVPKARQITRLLLARPDHLEPGEREQFAAIRAGCPHIDTLVGRFSLGTIVPLKSSPKSVVAPRERHHPGRFHVTFKAVKRQMYGRATFPLFRKRIILHPA